MNVSANPRLRIAHVGLGPIGLAALRSVAARPWAEIVGAVDLRPEFAGRDVGELADIGRLGVNVVPSLRDVGPTGTADIVVLCTGSRISSVARQVVDALAWGASVLTTCEELAYPWFHHASAAASIDAAAIAADRRVLATGINPGFAMDALALAVSGASDRVDAVRVARVVDAAARRGPLQLKIGAGISLSEFEERRSSGSIGHVGLVESVAMVGAGFGWRLDRIDETLDPVVADRATTTEFVSVQPGTVAGIRQTATGYRGDAAVIHLDLEMQVAPAAPGDVVTLAGRPLLTMEIRGFHGDVCTAAIAANAVAAIGNLPPGLRTMLDLVPLRGPGG